MVELSNHGLFRVVKDAHGGVMGRGRVVGFLVDARPGNIVLDLFVFG